MSVFRSARRLKRVTRSIGRGNNARRRPAPTGQRAQRATLQPLFVRTKSNPQPALSLQELYKNGRAELHEKGKRPRRVPTSLLTERGRPVPKKPGQRAAASNSRYKQGWLQVIGIFVASLSIGWPLLAWHGREAYYAMGAWAGLWVVICAPLFV